MENKVTAGASVNCCPLEPGLTGRKVRQQPAPRTAAAGYTHNTKGVLEAGGGGAEAWGSFAAAIGRRWRSPSKRPRTQLQVWPA
jgi:hypothetical protein